MYVEGVRIHLHEYPVRQPDPHGAPQKPAVAVEVRRQYAPEPHCELRVQARQRSVLAEVEDVDAAVSVVVARVYVTSWPVESTLSSTGAQPVAIIEVIAAAATNGRTDARRDVKRSFIPPRERPFSASGLGVLKRLHKGATPRPHVGRFRGSRPRAFFSGAIGRLCVGLEGRSAM